MALIKCPECGKENVSSFAHTCPDCGFGIKDYYMSIEEETHRKQLKEEHELRKKASEETAARLREYRINNILLPEKPSKNRHIMATAMCGIMALLGWFGVFSGLGLIWLIIAILFTAATVYSPTNFRHEMEEYERAISNPREYQESVVAKEDQRSAEKDAAERQTYQEACKENVALTCPKCGSTQIQITKKGFGLGKAAAGGLLIGPVGLLGGAIGSNKIQRVCINCKHTF